MDTLDQLTAPKDEKKEAERKKKEVAAKRRAKIMAKMSAMQKNFIKENAELFENTSTELFPRVGSDMDLRWTQYITYYPENWVRQSIKCRPGPQVIKLFSCSTQLSMKFSLLINMKMPTIFGIFSSPEQRSGRAIVLPRALALASTNVKVFVKVFKTSLFPNLTTDLIHLWYDDTYWPKILRSTIPTTLGHVKVKVTD